MSELKQQIEKLFAGTFKDSHGIEWPIYNQKLKDRILGLLADYVCMPRKQLEDYINFVDGLRSHGKPKEVMIKYEIYKKLLGDEK